MNEIDLYGTVIAFLMAGLFVSVCLTILFADPIDRWLEKMTDKMKKRRAKSA